LDTAYYDLQLFVLGSAPLQATGGPFPWPLEVARFLAPAVTLFAVVEVLRVLFVQEIRRALARQQRNHVVVCGDSALAEAVAARETAAGNQVVAVGSDTAVYPGVVSVEGDARDPRTLIRARAGRAERLYAVDGDASVNVAVVLGAAGLRPSHRRAPAIYASIPDPDLLRALNARRLGAAQSRVEFFNAEELAARQLAAAELGQLSRQPANRLLIGGMTTFGRALVVELGRQWRTRWSAAERLRITVVDPAAATAVTALLGQYPFLRDSCELDPQDSHVDLATWAGSAEIPADLARTYICYANEERALRAAFTATELWRGPESVLVRLDTYALFGIDFHGVGTVFDETTSVVRPFGVLDVAADPDLIRSGIIDQIARELHERYLQIAISGEPASGLFRPTTDARVPWLDLPEEFRDSLRSYAWDIGRKLRSMGQVVVPVGRQIAPFELSSVEIEQLARMEHARWTEEMRERGWRLHEGYDGQRRTHPDLVPWDSLSELSRQKSRDNVRWIPEILASLGMQVVRTRDTAIN
jgi:hypothetical protein